MEINVNETKKTVTFFIDSLGGGGAERVVSVLSNHLVQTGRYDVRIVMLRNVPTAYPLDDRVHLLYVQDMSLTSRYSKLVRRVFAVYRQVRQGVFKRLMTRLGYYQKMPKLADTAFSIYAQQAIPIREYLRSNPGSTAFGFLIRSNIAMLMAAKGLDVKTVFCERNNPVRPDMAANIMMLRDRIVHRCSAAVFQTQDQQDYYTQLNCPKAVIPNPLKENLPAPFAGQRRKEIVNFCRLNKQKNIPLLMDAFALLQQEHPDYTLRIYGKGDEKESLIALAKEKGLDNAVFFEDFATDIHDRIRDAAMYVCSSDFEGLSNSMLEALAIGIPCVCTDCEGGGARMIIQDHINGILVPVRDVQALYAGMKEIAENPVLAQNLSQEAAKIRDDLSIEKIADRWESIIG